MAGWVRWQMETAGKHTALTVKRIPLKKDTGGPEGPLPFFS